MSWNHRVLAHELEEGIYLEIHEVYYDENGQPHSYTENSISVGADDLQGIQWVLEKMKACTNKPILWAGDQFPKEYHPE